MKRHALGSSGLEVPIVCLGTMTFGEQNDEESSFRIMDRALELGINFFDAAEIYPVPPSEATANATETIIGRWLKARNNRDQVLLATKVASFMPGLQRNWVTASRSQPPKENPEPPALTRQQIHEACNASLRRLNTDYIDLYQLHWPARYVPAFGGRAYDPSRERYPVAGFEEQVTAVGELIREGKIRHWGVSNETTYGVCQMCETAKRLGVPLPVSIQNDVSIVQRLFEADLAEACAPSHYNIGLLAYGCLAGGTLSGKYLDGNTPPPNSRHVKYPGFQPRYHAPRAMAAAADYAALAKRHGLTPTQLALAWAGSRWYMGSVIIGATTLEQLEENAAACNMTLSDEALAGVTALWLKHGNANISE